MNPYIKLESVGPYTSFGGRIEPGDTTNYWGYRDILNGYNDVRDVWKKESGSQEYVLIPVETWRKVVDVVYQFCPEYWTSARVLDLRKKPYDDIKQAIEESFQRLMDAVEALSE